MRETKSKNSPETNHSNQLIDMELQSSKETNCGCLKKCGRSNCCGSCEEKSSCQNPNKCRICV